jgi:ABC-type phosphate/phosphonate transport system substrate-binding protein
MRNALAALATALLAAATIGCQTTGARLLNFIGLSQKPLAVMYASEKTELPALPQTLLDPFSASKQMHDALGKATQRVVTPDLCFSFQLEGNLALGICHLAVLSPIQYANLTEKSKYPVVAMAVDDKGRVERCGLLIVAVGSPIREVADVRGKRVAFGFPRDARTHHAGLALLKENGVAKTDLALDLLPVPGALRVYPRPIDVIQAVLNNGIDAGFIDEQAWEDLPESAATGKPSRAGLRAIAKTAAVAEGFVLRSPELDAATAESVRGFFLNVGKEQPDVLRSLRLSGYARPDDAVLSRAAALKSDAPAAAGSKSP